MTSPEEPLAILYQDHWLVAVDKPAGQLVHPADIPQNDDRVTMKILRDQLGHPVYVIHRLDRPTTGVLLLGLQKDPARAISQQFAQQEVEKTYWAITRGAPAGMTVGDIWKNQEPLQKNENSPIQKASTHFKLLDHIDPHCLSGTEKSRLSLIEARPQTGRYHQIRRHLKLDRAPIVGDYRYAGIEESDFLGTRLGTGTRMLLLAKTLSFQHPITGKNIMIEAPIDPMFAKCFPSLSQSKCAD